MTGVLATFEQALMLIPSFFSPWPGFQPSCTPYVVYDGERTVVYQQEPPSPEWVKEEGRISFPGRHPTVVANSAIRLENGSLAASLLLSSLPNDARLLAALAVHEAFHVFQQTSPLPCWEANELDALTYPADDVTFLALQHMEDAAMTSALHGGPDWQTWAARALAWRKRRFELCSSEHAAYERAMERVEGLAHYVEVQFLKSTPVISSKPLGVRQRSYVLGASWAMLLDRMSDSWKPALLQDGCALDELLARYLPTLSVGSVPGHVVLQAQQWADEMKRDRTRQEQEFENQPGVVVSLALPKLMLRGFDPMNLILLSDERILHRRYLRFGNETVHGEIMGRPCTTRFSGKPLASSIEEVRVTGVQEVRLYDSGRRLEAAGLSLSAWRGQWYAERGTWRYRE